MSVPSPPSESFWLSRWARSIFFFSIVLAVAGVFLAFRIPIAVFPQTNFPRVVIGVDNGVMPVEQMEVTITRPIEDAVNSVPGLVTVRSITSRGSAEVSLFFDWNVDMFQTLQLVNAALSRVQQELPSTAVITTNRLTFATFPILGYALTSNTVSQTRLLEIATYDLKPPLNRLDGVSTVTVQGGQVPEYHIIPNTAKLISAQIAIPDIVNAIQQTNLLQSPGLYEANHQLILALVGDQASNLAELAQISVKSTASGVPIHLSDIAQVTPATEPVYTIVTSNGQPAVLINIARQPTSNTVTVADKVAAEMTRLRTDLPQGVTVTPFYDQSHLVRDSIASVRDAILIGLILAAIILVLFLRDWSASLVAGLVIPVTILVTFIALWALGESFNLMTLGGLAAAVGLVIDDAIVVVENIALHREAGENRIEAVRKALAEITHPLIGSTITPIVVFLPLVSVTGVTGTFFRALALTMTVALLTSLALALTWTPALSLTFLRGNSRQAKIVPIDAPSPEESEHHHGIMAPVLRVHERVLRLALAKPLWLAAACGLLIVGGFFAYKGLGSDLLPEMDEGGFVLDYIMPAGSSLQETNRVLLHIDKILHNIPEVTTTSRRTGLQMGLAAVTEANTGDFTVMLKDHRSRGIDEVMQDARERIKAAEPELDVEFTQVLQDMIGDLSNAPEPIQIKLFSTSQDLLNQLGPARRRRHLQSPRRGRRRERHRQHHQRPRHHLPGRPRPRRALRLHHLRSRRRCHLHPRRPHHSAAPHPERPPLHHPRPPRRLPPRPLDTIQNTVFVSSTGKLATLGSLAHIQQLPPQNEIIRENLQLMVAVTGRLEGSDLGTAVARVQKAVANLHLPSTVRVNYGGTYQTQQQSFHELLQVLLLALVLVFGVLLAEFRNFSAPASILVSSILSTAGVIFALLITGTTFNVASFMGLIMVIGIVAKNGILLLDADQRFRAGGMSPRDAMIQAARRRLRPIVMTALAAMTGMLPLAFALGQGSQMLQPLAIAVIGGLTISMALSLIVTPAVYYFLARE